MHFHVQKNIAVALFSPIPFLMAWGPGCPLRIVVKVALLHKNVFGKET